MGGLDFTDGVFDDGGYAGKSEALRRSIITLRGLGSMNCVELGALLGAKEFLGPHRAVVGCLAMMASFCGRTEKFFMVIWGEVGV